MVDHIITAPFEQSIIVHAGPGAGKTFLIAQRIAYLLKSGLRKNSRIACITYTNTGVEEVADELIPTHFNHLPSDLYLDTIHSFLLEHILKPYGHFLPEIPEGFRLTAPSGFVNRFITFEMRQLPEYRHQAFENIYYDPQGNYVCYRPIGNQDWTPTQQQMRSFKRMMHSKGFIDLPDVLWFSLKLLRHYPAIAESMACRFETIIVDEFQDTTDLQVEILNILLAIGKTSLFIVGDPNQSIFVYAGARPHLFTNYCLDPKFRCPACGEIVHQIPVNRRSSIPIITFLNRYSTIPGGQVPGDQEWTNHNEPVRLFIGGIDRAPNVAQFQSMVLNKFFQLLKTNGIDQDQKDSFGVYAHENKTVAALNHVSQGGGNIVASDNYEQIKRNNKPLHRISSGLLIAIKHKQFGEWTDAYSQVNDVLTYHFYGTTPAFCRYDDPQIGLNRQLWGVAIWKIMQELPNNDQFSVSEWLQEVKTLVSNSISLVGGLNVRRKLNILDCRGEVVRRYAARCTVADALSSVMRPRLHTENFRTIHGAKGTQRDAVLAYARDANELEQWLLCNNIDQSETSRIGYVGFSRAKKILCIACESITRNQYQQLLQLPLNVFELDNQPRLFP
jgi:hypothetical protein